MGHVYTKKIEDWCVDRATHQLPTLSNTGKIVFSISTFVKTYKYKTVRITKKEISNSRNDIFIKGVPSAFIDKHGTYFEMECGLWRRIVTSSTDYNIYNDFIQSNQLMSTEHTCTAFMKVYGYGIYCNVYSYMKTYTKDFITESRMLRNMEICVVNCNIQHRTITEENLKYTQSYYSDVPIKYVQGAGVYVMIDDNVWRKVCSTPTEFHRYISYLNDNRLLD